MLLSLELIKRRLEGEYQVSAFGASHADFSLERPKCYYPGLAILKGNLYIIEGEALDLEDWEGCFLVCVDRADGITGSNYAGLLNVADANPGQIINSVNEIFDFYDKWDLLLKTMPKAGAGRVSGLLDASIPVFGNIMRLMNTRMQFEYISDEDFDKTLTDVTAPDDSGFRPIGTVRYHIAHKEYLEKDGARAPYIMPAGLLPFRCMCVNLFYDEKPVGRIIVNEVHRPFHDTDLALLAHLAKYVEDAYNDLIQTRGYPVFELRNAISQALDGRDPGAAGLTETFGRYRWERGHAYVCLKFASSEITSPERYYFCREIEKRFAESCALEFDENIVMVVNLSLAGETMDSFLQNLGSFAKEGAHKFGASTEFHDISSLKWFYQQACIALEAGLRGKLADWVFRFDDVKLPYLMGKCAEELPPDFVCQPDLVRLRRIDAETGSDYYGSLSHYLKSCRNAVQASGELFIHRLTLIYRLNKIKDMTSLKWDTPEDYFKLLLSVYILENDPGGAPDTNKT